jgi:excisionase family DNA binding protein
MEAANTNLDSWIAKSDVAKRTGLTERTIERKVKRGELRMATRDIPGRKPLPVFHPQDVERLTQKTLKPVPLANGDIPKSRQVVSVSVRPKLTDRLPELVAVAESTALTYRVYLTEKEAALFLGLSPTYVRRARKEGTLEGFKIPGVRGWRFHRDTLRQHTVSELSQ